MVVIDKDEDRLGTCDFPHVLGDATDDEVLAAFRSTDLQAAKGAVSPELQALIRDLEDSRQARVGSTTIADLMPR